MVWGGSQSAENATGVLGKNDDGGQGGRLLQEGF